MTPDTLVLSAWLCWIGLKILVLMKGSFESLENFLSLSGFFVRIQN